MKKTDEELIEEFLANGGQIEKLPPIEPEYKKPVGSLTKKIPQIMTLPEAELMFGRKIVKKSKPKKADFSDINMDLIPDHLKKMLNVGDNEEKTKEKSIEADQNSRGTEASDKS